MKRFYKIWWTGPAGKTAALVVDTDAFPRRTTTLQEYSRLFPPSECRKMQKFFMGQPWPTFEEAFQEKPGIRPEVSI